MPEPSSNEMLKKIGDELGRQADIAELDGLDDLFSAVKDELSRQADRKSSLEQRAITVITTSSALATIVFTVVAAVTKISTVEKFVKAEHVWIQVGVGVFLLAAATALVVNIPLGYGAVDVKSFSDIAQWITTNRDNTNTHAAVVGELVQNAIKDVALWQSRNYWKAIILEVAFFFEVVAVGFLLAALVAILARI